MQKSYIASKKLQHELRIYCQRSNIWFHSESDIFYHFAIALFSTTYAYCHTFLQMNMVYPGSRVMLSFIRSELINQATNQWYTDWNAPWRNEYYNSCLSNQPSSTGEQGWSHLMFRGGLGPRLNFFFKKIIYTIK